MLRLRRYASSSIGAKQLVAVTGLVLLLFAIQHMVGHLQMFGGRHLYNAYANFLQDLWELKWPTRVVLLIALFVHLGAALWLAERNHAARPVPYARYAPSTSSIIGRSMAFTGVAVFAFLAFHIVHFTAGLVQPEYFHQPAREGMDTYGMFVHGFQNPVIYVIYMAGTAIISLHLGHGAASWVQTLGWRPRFDLVRLGRIVAITLFAGYALPPTAVVLGIIR
jgi:succinate dehydrogenase / fumarate reductase, cytochrome b subunit